ncbi:MAG TPA: hypothetical protein VGL82_01730 [Bryobacteraceae bacterium]|jgi:hypothetical protein
MKRTLHIFLKDAQRCWPYLAIVVAITAALAYLTPKWAPMESFGSGGSNRTVDILQILLPIAWWFTIAHVVQGEGLVGDRQFWVTRPYSWTSLLLAKVGFCVAFFFVPLLAHDWVILSSANFPPTQLMPDLLWRYGSLAGFLMLPAFVLAALTRNMRQFVLATMMLLIGGFVNGLVGGAHPPSAVAIALTDASRSAGVSWLHDWGSTALFFGGAVVLLVWQYAQRRTAVARAIVVAAYLCSLASATWSSRPISPAVWEKTVVPEDRYPGVAVAFAQTRGRLSRHETYGVPNKVQVDIPVDLTGRRRDLLRYSLAAISMDTGHGEAWNSNWNWYVNVAERDGADWIEFGMDLKDFQRLNREPVKMRAVFGVIVYEEQARISLRPGGGWVRISSFGSVSMPDIPDLPRMPVIWWRAPLRSPAQRFLCSVRGSGPETFYQAEWDGVFPSTPDYVHISPVISQDAYLQPRKLELRAVQMRLPKDAVGEFTLEKPLALVRRDLDVSGIRLGDYVVR